MFIISLIEVAECKSDKDGLIVAAELVEAAIQVSTMQNRGGMKSRSVKLLGSKLDQFRKRCKVHRWTNSLALLKKAFSVLKETRDEEERVTNELYSL